MARSTAATVDQYLAELPDERRAVIAAVRELILRHLPAGYQEAMTGGMINYEIPLERYPTTYNGRPLPYIALAAQKQYYALYMPQVSAAVDQRTWWQQAFARAGKKLDMGKSCLRFRALDDVPWDVIGQVVASTTPEQYIAHYEAVRKKA